MIICKSLWVTISIVLLYSPVDLEKHSILQDKAEISMPKGWKPMSKELIKIKYPGQQPPTLVYSNQPGTISLAFNHTSSKATPEMLDQFKNVLKASLENAYPDAEWEETGMKMINNKKVYYMKVITQAMDDKIYNHMFFTDMEERLLLCSFNCVMQKINGWRPVADSIMHSLVIKK